MKQPKIVKILLILFIFFVCVIQVNAKNAGEKCEEDKKCKEICSFTKGYTGLINAGEVLNYTVKIYHYDNDGDWVVYAKNDEGRVSPFVEKKGKWSKLFSDSEKISGSKHVYVQGTKEKEMKDGKCPEHVFINVKQGSANTWIISNLCFDNDNASCEKLKPKFWNVNNRIAFDDSPSNTNYVVSENGESVSNGEEIDIIEPPIQSGDGCDGIFGPKVTEDINIAFKYIKYIGPVLVIVLGILDFIKAVASGDSSDFSKAWKRLLTRLIIAVLLFFIVDLLKFIFKIFGITTPDHCIK